jgi:hypothetical protein
VGLALLREIRVCSFSCCGASPAQSFSGRSHKGLVSIFFCLHFLRSPTSSHSQSQSYFSRSGYRSVGHPSGNHDQTYIYTLYVIWLTSLTRGSVYNLLVKLLLGLAIPVTLGSKSRRTHDHITCVPRGYTTGLPWHNTNSLPGEISTGTWPSRMAPCGGGLEYLHRKPASRNRSLRKELLTQSLCCGYHGDAYALRRGYVF